jgi:hypothetical protein
MVAALIAVAFTVAVLTAAAFMVAALIAVAFTVAVLTAAALIAVAFTVAVLTAAAFMVAALIAVAFTVSANSITAPAHTSAGTAPAVGQVLVAGCRRGPVKRVVPHM